MRKAAVINKGEEAADGLQHLATKAMAKRTTTTLNQQMQAINAVPASFVVVGGVSKA